MAETTDVSGARPEGSGTPSRSAPEAPGHAPVRTNWTVFIGTAVGILAVTGWALIAPESASTALGAVVSWVGVNLGWFYILTATVVIVFVLVVALSRQGRTRLGPDHSRPQFPLFSWASMLFAAGIGVDLMFYSVLEPVTQYYAPPQGGGETAEAARQAVVWTLFHYGITGWALYALMGMAFGYFAYRFHLPLSIRSALYPIIGKRIKGRTGDAVDIAAMLGTIFGVATSLGIGVVMINFGLGFLFDVPQGISVQTVLIGLSVLLAIVSAVSGVDKGIRRLSELNVLLAVGLMLYVLVFGRTEFLLNGIITNVGDYLSRFGGMTMDAMPFDHPDQWMSDWTLFFWAWWVAWSPFVGLFLARISRGRTIRQFVLGVLSVPFLFILLWISVFGNSALGFIHGQGDTGFGETLMGGQEESFYTLLTQYPGATFAIAIATLTALLFYVTSADSGALVMANFCSNIDDPQKDGPNWMRIFWALATGALTVAMLSIGGISTLQSATIIFGLPFAIVLYLIMFGLWKALKVEGAQMDASRAAWAGVRAGDRAATIEPSARTRSWRQRLSRSMSYPDQRDVAGYVGSTVRPALEEVAEEMRSAGVDAVVERGTDPATHLPFVSLTERMEGEQDFIYQVYPVACPVPHYLLAPQKDHERSFRLEPFALTGSRGYDVYGYTKEQLIHDVLDNHERHLEFIRLSGGPPETGATAIIGSAPTVTDWSADFAETDAGEAPADGAGEGPAGDAGTEAEASAAAEAGPESR